MCISSSSINSNHCSSIFNNHITSVPRSRETANLEYLKNIILHYMSSDKIGKDHMINAIATVLHFSPHEVSD